MLYLIRTFGRSKKQRSLKVGFTDNISSRLSSYYHQNPYYETVSKREGDELLEMKLHLYLEALGYKQSFLNEWFVDIDEVIQHFHDTENKINRVIWRNRQNLIDERDFKKNGNKLRCRIYEDLRLIYYKEEFQKPIDKAWKREGAKKILKKMRDNFF